MAIDPTPGRRLLAEQFAPVQDHAIEADDRGARVLLDECVRPLDGPRDVSNTSGSPFDKFPMLVSVQDDLLQGYTKRLSLEAEWPNLTRGWSFVSVRLRGDEPASIEQAARAAGIPVSTFIRRAALGASNAIDFRAASAQAEAIERAAQRLRALLRGEAT